MNGFGAVESGWAIIAAVYVCKQFRIQTLNDRIRFVQKIATSKSNDFIFATQQTAQMPHLDDKNKVHIPIDQREIPNDFFVFHTLSSYNMYLYQLSHEK